MKDIKVSQIYSGVRKHDYLFALSKANILDMMDRFSYSRYSDKTRVEPKLSYFKGPILAEFGTYMAVEDGEMVRIYDMSAGEYEIRTELPRNFAILITPEGERGLRIEDRVTKELFYEKYANLNLT